jgi:hypothetical protein
VLGSSQAHYQLIVTPFGNPIFPVSDTNLPNLIRTQEQTPITVTNATVLLDRLATTVFMSTPNRTEVNFTYSVPTNVGLDGRSVILNPRVTPQPGIIITMELVASFMNRTWTVSGQP